MNAKTDETAHRQVVAERITVGLVQKTADELQRLQRSTGLSKTDLVNRAISMYLFIEEQGEAGHELLRRRKDTGDVEVIRFL
jgi:hypothetical protein